MKIYYDSKLAKSLLFGSFKTCMFFGVVLTEYTALSEKVKRHEEFFCPVFIFFTSILFKSPNVFHYFCKCTHIFSFYFSSD